MPLAKSADFGDARYAGCAIDFAEDIDPAVQDALLCGFDFVVAPIVRPGYRPPAPAPSAGGQLTPPFQRSDVLYLSSTARVSQVVGQISPWIEPDSEDASLRAESLLTLRQELAWAGHLGLQAVLLPRVPAPMRGARYAQAVMQALSGLSTMAVWLSVPLSRWPAPGDGGSDGGDGGGGGGASGSGDAAGTAPPGGPSLHQLSDPWESWHQFRQLTDFHSLLGCVLEVGRELPPPALIDRWAGEPVKALLLPTHVFGSNKRGYPVLPKPHQELLARFFRLGVQVVLTGECVHEVPDEKKTPLLAAQGGAGASGAARHGADGAPPPPPGLPTLASFIPLESGGGFAVVNPGESHPLRAYWEYLCFVFRKLEPLPEQDRLERDYQDYLQAPLQPLQDNLESSTYEVFEKDIKKYTQYEQAVYRALLDRVRDEDAADTVTTVMVVGAGRGPLVRASMRASGRAGRAIRVYAVEKNPNAVVHIQDMIASEGWQDVVSLVHADMRTWAAPHKADILVSELLGSFGDNELSPECLDGAQRFLALDGVSIPQSYTSYLAPVTSHKLYNDVKNYKDLEHFETPYVVKFHRHHLLAPTQPVFTFEHPNWSDPIDNSRSASLCFERLPGAGSAALHGFAGYFECSLYKDVTLNTHPPTHTRNMFSWFPIFFPLREPVYVPAGASIDVAMWRCGAAHKVWYEWALTGPVAGPVHNVGGRSYYVGT